MSKKDDSKVKKGAKSPKNEGSGKDKGTLGRKKSKQLKKKEASKEASTPKEKPAPPKKTPKKEPPPPPRDDDLTSSEEEESKSSAAVTSPKGKEPSSAPSEKEKEKAEDKAEDDPLMCRATGKQLVDPVLINGLFPVSGKAAKSKLKKGEVIVCPVSNFKTSAAGALCPDYYRASLVEAANKAAGDLMCALCEEEGIEEPATKFVIDVSLPLCDLHAQLHARGKTKHHKIRDVEEEDNANVQRRSTVKCPTYPENNLELWCEKCKKVICRDCALKGCNDHTKVATAHAVKPFQADLAKMNKDVGAKIKQVSSSEAAVAKALVDLDKNKAKAVSDVDVMVERMIAEINARRAVLVKEITAMADDKRKRLATQQETLAFMSTGLASTSEYLQAFLKEGSAEEKLLEKDALFAALTYALEAKYPATPVDNGALFLVAEKDERDTTLLIQKTGQISGGDQSTKVKDKGKGKDKGKKGKKK